MEVIGSIYTEVSEGFQRGIIGGGTSPGASKLKHTI